MHIAILTFEGFNELDSIVALGILGRVRKPGWQGVDRGAHSARDVDEWRHARKRSARSPKHAARMR